MDIKLAEETSLLALQLSGKLDRHLGRIQAECSEDDFRKFRKGIGYVLGYLYTEVMDPIYREHPQLRPQQLGGPYTVDEGIYED